MKAEFGPSAKQDFIPRYLVDLSYSGASLINRPLSQNYAGLYGAKYDAFDSGSLDGELHPQNPSVTNIATDGSRVFGEYAAANEVSTQMPNSNSSLGRPSYVAELKDGPDGKTWYKTDVPAPRAATPLLATSWPQAPSFGSGADGRLLLLNGLTASKGSPDSWFAVGSS